MAIISKNYVVSPGEYGLCVISEKGRCTDDERAAIEDGVCHDFVLVKIPEAFGAILKSMDGTLPQPVAITHPTTGKSILCVQTQGYLNAASAVQTSGPYIGKAVCAYLRVWQQVGGVS